MNNIISYVQTECRSFDEHPFSSVDSLVLSQLAYLHFDDFVPSVIGNDEGVTIEAIGRKKYLDSLFAGVRDERSNIKLFDAACQSKRFKDIRLNYYINHLDYKSEKQFSAVTYFINDELLYVAYRGTDSTFIGWKEDFNLAYMTPIPSQEEGRRYMNRILSMTNENVFAGGHSKGGNIAVYSAVKCDDEVKNRILKVFSHDGPGFKEDILKEYPDMRFKIEKTMPESALVGMLLQNSGSYKVVKSHQIGIMQHDPFSWIVKDGDFIYVQDIDNAAKFSNKAINEWIDGLTVEKREFFADSLYEVIDKSNIKTVDDFSHNLPRSSVSVFNAVNDLDSETKSFLLDTIGSLFKIAAKIVKFSQ